MWVSPNPASSAEAQRRPRYTCTWAAPTCGYSSHPTAKRNKKRPTTYRWGTRRYVSPCGAPRRKNGRRFSALGWDLKQRRHNSARSAATTRQGKSPWTSFSTTCSGRGFLRGSSQTRGWNTSSAHLTALPPRYTGGSQRQRATHPAPHPRPSKDCKASFCLVGDTMECPAREDPHLYQNLPRGFPGHLRGVLFTPWIIGRNSMAVLEARIVGTDWAQEWSRWCAATRSLEVRAELYAAIPLEGSGLHIGRQPLTNRGTGPEGQLDKEAAAWLHAAQEPHQKWRGDLSSLLRKPLPPQLVMQWPPY